MSKRFRVIVECQTPEGSNDAHADAYAGSVRDYVRGPLFVEGVGFNLGVQSVEYEMVPDEKSGEDADVVKRAIDVFYGVEDYCEGRR